MSSILNKFRKQAQNDAPEGIKMENTSFGQQNGTYQPPVIPAVQLPQSNQPRKKGRPGGGWDDDQEPQQQQQIISTTKPQNTVNLINDTPPKQNENKSNVDVILPPQPQIGSIQLSRVTDYKRGQLLTYEELEFGGFEYEFHLINEAIKLGGIKLKQSDTVLKDFAKAVQTLQEQLIGSILLNKLHSEDNWKVQIRCIYAIQYICQQFMNYRDFFQINQQYLSVETDQQILQSAIEQTLAEINGKQINKQKEFQLEFREPPKPTQQLPNPTIQQPNLIDIIDSQPKQPQQVQQTQQQQKLDLKSLKIKQPQQQQQPQSIQQQIQLPQQNMIPQQTKQQNNQINLLDAFSDLSLQSYEQQQQQQQQKLQPQIQQQQQVTYQQPVQQQQNISNGISFDDLLNQNTQPQVQQQQPAQKKNAFGFLKKDSQQQQQVQQNIQQQPQITQPNLLNSPINQYQQPQNNFQPQNQYGQQAFQQQPLYGQSNYTQTFQQYNQQQQQYNLVQQGQFMQEKPKLQQQQQQQQVPNTKDNAFDFLNF